MTEPARFVLQSAAAGPLRADRNRNSFRITTDIDAFDFFLSGRVLHGRLSIDDGREEARLKGGDVFMHRVGVGEHLELDGFDAALVCLPLDRIAETAEQRFGIEARELHCEAMTPISAEMARQWSITVDYVHDLMISAGDTGAPGRPAGRHGGHGGPGDVPQHDHVDEPAPAGRAGRPGDPAARDRLHRGAARAGDPITVADIARAAGVTPRALQAGFRRHLDSSPATYLRRARLERAHRELEAADPDGGVTVAGVAARWGFLKPSPFAAFHRSVFGRSPSSTLRG